MSKFWLIVAQIFSAVLVLIGAVILFMPSERVERAGPFTGDVTDPEAYLAAREAAIDGITPGTGARIIWAAEPNETTPVSILYLHGFSATSEEIRPVPDEVAAGLGANLIFARLTGHGRDGAALAAATASDWVADTAEALAIARAIGDEVIVIGVSTGATLAAIAATEADMAESIAGIVMMSPNFLLAHPAGIVLEAPGASVFLPWIAGAEREFEAQNADHQRFWTRRYPSVSVLSMAAVMRHARRRDYSVVDIPLLLIYAREDQVVSAEAAETIAAEWGGPTTVALQDLPATGVDAFAHVIAGDILSPAMTATIRDQILSWAMTLRP
ncbi:MAG: alpha/beta fold hydrolase [Pseudomonadota bacterium]